VGGGRTRIAGAAKCEEEKKTGGAEEAPQGGRERSWAGAGKCAGDRRRNERGRRAQTSETDARGGNAAWEASSTHASGLSR